MAQKHAYAHRVGSDRTVQMAVTEYHLNPESIRANAGVLAIVVHNYGRLTHNLAVSDNGQSVAGTGPISPGQTVELRLVVGLALVLAYQQFPELGWPRQAPDVGRQNAVLARLHRHSPPSETPHNAPLHLLRQPRPRQDKRRAGYAAPAISLRGGRTSSISSSGRRGWDGANRI